jgi:hypothetical protein
VDVSSVGGSVVWADTNIQSSTWPLPDFPDDPEAAGIIVQGMPDPGVAADLESLMREAEGQAIGSVRGHAVAHLKVDYSWGRYFLNGKSATLEELRSEFSRLGRIGGAIFYYKANPTDGVPPEAETALGAICEARLPVTFTVRDYDPAVKVAEYFLPDGAW